MAKHPGAGIRAAAGVAVALAVGACDFISPTDTNPNAVPSATVDQLFTGIQVNTFFFAEGQLSRLASMWTQQMTGTDRQFASLDQYIYSETDSDDEFSLIYTGGGLVDQKQAIALAEEAGRRPYAGILKIHMAHMFGMAASVFGAIPFSEAANPEIEQPSLDSQVDVYTAVQGLLDEAIADLAAGGTGPGSADINFGGDPAAWTAIAHTLKARFHMHWAEVNGASAYQSARTAAQNGIMSPANNWRALHASAATENNVWHQFMRDRSGYISAGDHLVPLMVANNDPRLPFYYSQTESGAYVARSSALSETGFGAPTWDYAFVTCAENQFIRAESAFRLGDVAAARSAAEAGVACQEAEYGVDLTPLKSRFATLTGDALLREIMQQKYTALFLNIETWNDYKRTCLPGITPRTAGGVPARLFYGQQERQANTNIPEPGQQPLRNANDPNRC